MCCVIGEHAAWARALGGPRPGGGLAGPGNRPPGAFVNARGGTPAARSDAPVSSSCRRPSRRRRRMPRGPPPALSLLLMAGLVLAATPPPPPLEIVNPWLSACDLQPNNAADLQGACSAMWGLGGALCPPPCPSNRSSTTQCLYYLQESHKEELCGPGSDAERRRVALQTLRMRHCCEHKVLSTLPDADAVLRGGEACRKLLDVLLEVDALAARISCEFAEVLTRYDCAQTYSIAYTCNDCKVTTFSTSTASSFISSPRSFITATNTIYPMIIINYGSIYCHYLDGDITCTWFH